MQEIETKSDRRRRQQILTLVSKIRRLKNKLFSYGMSLKDTLEAILYQFLKAPAIDWTRAHNTTLFYQIQEKYKTDTGTAQLIMLLSSIIPNWQAHSIVQYLHKTLTYNSLAFGIDLELSDDSSNEDADMTSLLMKTKKKNTAAKNHNMRPRKRAYQNVPASKETASFTDVNSQYSSLNNPSQKPSSTHYRQDCYFEGQIAKKKIHFSIEQSENSSRSKLAQNQNYDQKYDFIGKQEQSSQELCQILLQQQDQNQVGILQRCEAENESDRGIKEGQNQTPLKPQDSKHQISTLDSINKRKSPTYSEFLQEELPQKKLKK